MEQNEALLTGCAASVSAREHGLRVRKELTRSRRDLRRTLHSATKIITKRTKARVGNSMQVVGALKFMQSEAKQTATRKLTSRLNRAKEAMRVQFAVSPRSVTPMSKGTGHSASSQSLRRPRSTRSVKSSAPAADARTTSALSRTQSQHQLRQRRQGLGLRRQPCVVPHLLLQPWHRPLPARQCSPRRPQSQRPRLRQPPRRRGGHHRPKRFFWSAAPGPSWSACALHSASGSAAKGIHVLRRWWPRHQTLHSHACSVTSTAWTSSRSITLSASPST